MISQTRVLSWAASLSIVTALPLTPARVTVSRRRVLSSLSAALLIPSCLVTVESGRSHVRGPPRIFRWPMKVGPRSHPLKQTGRGSAAARMNHSAPAGGRLATTQGEAGYREGGARGRLAEGIDPGATHSYSSKGA